MNTTNTVDLLQKHQFEAMGGRCGICGDAYDASPRQHEAPAGKYANGIIVKQYKAGSYCITLPLSLCIWL